MTEPRCEDYSWLIKDQCAHCLGHTLTPELEEYAQQLVQQGITTT